MKSKRKQDVPKTIGELRKRLAKLGNPWEVDPQFNIDDPLPEYPRGGQREEEIPEEHRLIPLEAGIDLIGLIKVHPPSNPFLRSRWVELGMLNQDQVEVQLSESDESEGGAA
jgi:hypothetical protein